MRRIFFVAALCATALFVLGMTCATNAPLVPGFVETPAVAYPRAEALFLITTTAPGGRDVRYVLDWGDGAIDTTNGRPSGDTVTVRHTWLTAGGFEVKALAFVQEEPGLASEWSEPLAVTVLANGVPAAYGLEGPGVALYGAWARFRVRATDSDGDSVAVQFDFNGTIGAWTAFGDTGAAFGDSFRFSTVETVRVRVRARDQKGSVSDWSDSLMVPVDTVGKVLWWWKDFPGEELPLGELLLVLDGTDEAVCFSSDDGWYRSVNVSTGRMKSVGMPTSPGDAFSGSSAYCPATGHIVVGGSERALYALTTSLLVAWSWTGGDTMDDAEWGTPAIRGDTIYAPRDNDTLYCFRDLGDTVELVEARRVSCMSLDVAPLVQSNGNVYCAGGAGQLYCWQPGLDSLAWVDSVVQDGDILCVAAGDNGKVYCGGSDHRVHAVDAAGEPYWSRGVEGEVAALAVGVGMVFAASGQGELRAIDSETSTTVWYARHSLGEVSGCPILVASGLIYYTDRDGVLHCVNQSDGSLVWSCDCPSYRDGARSRGGLDAPVSSPTITSSGNIILVGDDALYCVKGYRNGPLDPQAPWPKWQRDAHNTGSAGSRPGW